MGDKFRGFRAWFARGAIVSILLGCSAACLAQVRVLVDQVGYEPNAAKQAIVEGRSGDQPQGFTVVDEGTGQAITHGELAPRGPIDYWGYVFWIADFSSLQAPGRYKIQVHAGEQVVSSSIFIIEKNLLERETLSNVLYYFKGQRSSGDFDRADRHLKLPDGLGFADLHGGWYDATGDYGIHLSHQNLTSYFNPQQVPLVVWSLLKTYRTLQSRGEDDFTEYERRLLDEGLFGADFLTRLKRPGGSFYQSIDAPGRGKLARDRVIGNPNWRTQIKQNANDSTEQVESAKGQHAYEASFRSGGGMAIAALALASSMPDEGDISRSVYLRTAEDAFQFLAAHNRELLNDGKENIVDDYCALLAATELFRATHKSEYKAAARRRALALIGRLGSIAGHPDMWRADDASRPYFHPSDAGLPVISLLTYLEVAPEERAEITDAIARSLKAELALTAEGNNVFGYARQLVRMGNGTVLPAYFFPHDTEAAPWWQGEDARLASLAAAARLAAPLFADRPEFQRNLENYAWNQLHWIHGRNPFDVSLLMGSGHGEAAYMFFRSYKYHNAPGAIVNGITSAEDDQKGIAFNRGFAVTGKDEDWRWTEDWLPHAAWYLYAVSLPHAQ